MPPSPPLALFCSLLATPAAFRRHMRAIWMNWSPGERTPLTSCSMKRSGLQRGLTSKKSGTVGAQNSTSEFTIYVRVGDESPFWNTASPLYKHRNLHLSLEIKNTAHNSGYICHFRVTTCSSTGFNSFASVAYGNVYLSLIPSNLPLKRDCNPEGLN